MPVPAAPTLAAVDARVRELRLAWMPGSDGGSAVTCFNVYRGATSGSETLHATAPNAFYIDTGLGDDQTWFYKVSATNGVGESVKSNEESGTTTPFALTPSATATLTLTPATPTDLGAMVPS